MKLVLAALGTILRSKPPQEAPKILQNEAQDLPKPPPKKVKIEKGETLKFDDSTTILMVFWGLGSPGDVQKANKSS